MEMIRKIITSALLVLFICTNGISGDDKIIKGKDEEKTPENKWYDTVNMSGYVDVYYNSTMDKTLCTKKDHTKQPTLFTICSYYNRDIFPCSFLWAKA